MSQPAIPIALLALAASVTLAQDVGAQLTIRERVIIRIPLMAPLRPGRASIPPAIEWREKKGPQCLAMATLAGAIVRGRDSIDFVMTGGKRMRAKLEGDCKPIDFYADFYIKPTGDGQVCADRDSIRSRSGASCPIAKFRRLEEKR